MSRLLEAAVESIQKLSAELAEARGDRRTYVAGNIEFEIENAVRTVINDLTEVIPDSDTKTDIIQRALTNLKCIFE